MKRKKDVERTAMKKVLLIGLVALLAQVNPAHAQLGWTLDQCKAKFGEPTETENLVGGDTRVSFEPGIYSVAVSFPPKGRRVTFVIFNYTNGIRVQKDLVEIVAPYSPEIASWFKYLMVARGDRGTYLGFTWREINLSGDDVSVGYKNGQPVMTVYGDRDHIQLEAINAKSLKEQIEAEKD
jgi:hypothetical protein